MKRRLFLGAGCLHCLGLCALDAHAEEGWAVPARFTRPDLSTDEGGLWAMLDREETRLRRGAAIVRDAGLQAYLRSIVDKLAGEHAPDVRLYVVRTPHFNASMAPNGMMQIWTGTLLRMENEAQLAAVLGHEIGHYLQRHTVQRLRDAKSRSAFGQVLGVALGGVGLIAQLIMLAGMYSFSREHEREADRIGQALLKRAGYDPREAAVVWDNMIREVSAGAGGDPSSKSVMFATHPPSAERREALQQMAEGSQGDTGAATYRAQIEPHLAGLLEDEVRRGQYDESLVLLERMVKQRSDHALLLHYRGEARRLRGTGDDLDVAMVDFKAAAELGKAPAQTWRSIGLIHRQRKQGDAARAAFTRYLDAAPDCPDAGMIRFYLSEPATQEVS